MPTELIENNYSKEDRFQFGNNWMKFLSVLNDERITEAEISLKKMLEVDDLKGKTFLDIGSGSGLFSLAAMRLGAERVHSFDYDSQSVACGQQLKKQFFPEAAHWTVEQGSALDGDYLSSLGEWDIVYSWGVLHHTGDMDSALRNAAPMVRDNGKLFVAIYNKQRLLTTFWTIIKRWYVKGSFLSKGILLGIFMIYFILRGLFADLIQGRSPIRRYTEQYTPRGMSVFYDWIDWIGGYPFETAKPEEVLDLYREQGFRLDRLVTCWGSSGINEFVFSKVDVAQSDTAGEDQ